MARALYVCERKWKLESELEMFRCKTPPDAPLLQLIPFVGLGVSTLEQRL